jgi:hypothetical protein
MAQATLRQIPALIAERKSFRGNSMPAVAIDRNDGFRGHIGIGTAGRLGTEEARKFYAEADRIVYLVKSYDTPIAWVLDDGTTYKVGQKFSVTTSRHQGKLYTL